MDNYDVWLQHDLEAERWRESRPVCASCGEHIQDEKGYMIDGYVYCHDCGWRIISKQVDEFERELDAEYEVDIDDLTEEV